MQMKTRTTRSFRPYHGPKAPKPRYTIAQSIALNRVTIIRNKT